jgi:hypothetical protein
MCIFFTNQHHICASDRPSCRIKVQKDTSPTYCIPPNAICIFASQSFLTRPFLKKWLNAISNHLPPGRVHERAHLISHAGGFSDASAKPMTCVVNKPNKTCIKHLHILPTWVCDVIGHREYYFSIMIFGVPSCTLHQVFFSSDSLASLATYCMVVDRQRYLKFILETCCLLCVAWADVYFTS